VFENPTVLFILQFVMKSCGAAGRSRMARHWVWVRTGRANANPKAARANPILSKRVTRPGRHSIHTSETMTGGPTVPSLLIDGDEATPKNMKMPVTAIRTNSRQCSGRFSGRQRAVTSKTMLASGTVR
jgi:hypothetical protein